MGQFSWLDCKNGTQILDDVEQDSYVLVPEEFGGGHIAERCYDGYGHFGGYDIYALVAKWNVPEQCTGDVSVDRLAGVALACMDKDNARLKYPIKITHDPNAMYEDCDYSPTDPDQGWADD